MTVGDGDAVLEGLTETGRALANVDTQAAPWKRTAVSGSGVRLAPMPVAGMRPAVV